METIKWKSYLFSILKEKLLNISEIDLNSLFTIFEKAILEDWELTQFESYLKEENLFSEEQENILKIWKSQKAKIHEMIIKEVTWNNTLNKISWRVDTKNKSKKVPEMNELTAIVEMIINESQQNTTKVIRFEMNKIQLQKILSQIQDIQKQLAKFT